MRRLMLQSAVIAGALLVLNFEFASIAFAGEQGSANGQPFNTLRSQIEMLESNFDETVAMLQSQIDNLVNSHATQDEVIAAIEAAANLLEARVATNEGDIAALQAAEAFQDQLILALQTNLSALEARVTDNKGDIAAIILVDQGTQGLIAAIQTQITNLNLLIAANAGDITALQTQVGSLSTQLASLQTDLALKQNRVLSVCGPGSSISVINPDGTVVCETDDVSAVVGTLQQLTVSATQGIPSAGLPFGFLVLGSLTKTAFCPSTHLVTGGGHEIVGFVEVLGILFPGDPRAVHVARSRPLDQTGWEVFVSNANINAFGCCRVNLTVLASCAKVWGLIYDILKTLVYGEA